jgi:small subunit ribosomal protein S17
MLGFNLARKSVKQSIINNSLPSVCIKSLLVTSRMFSMDVETEYKQEIEDVKHIYDEKKKRRQSLIGIITSDKNEKSVTVEVKHLKLFAKYGKLVNVSKKIMAHDEDEIGEIGDRVRIVPCRPMSKKKRHSLIDVLSKAQKFDASAK